MKRATTIAAAALIAVSATVQAAPSAPVAQNQPAASEPGHFGLAAQGMFSAASADLNAFVGKVEKGAVKGAAAVKSVLFKAKNALAASRRDAPAPADPEQDTRNRDPA